MNRVIGVPFLRPNSAHVVADEWNLQSDVGMQPLPPILPHWDYNTDLVLQRTVLIDAEKVRRECGLESETPLRLAAFWMAQGTPLRGTVDEVDLPGYGEMHISNLAGRLAGGGLCGTVQLETKLLLPVGLSPKGLRPSRAGSVLWTDRVQIALEGSASRFPTAVVDFSELLGAPDAAGWLLSWNPLNLHEPFMGSVQLLVNSRHSAVVDAVTSRRGDGSAAIRSAVYYDVARCMIRGAVANDEFLLEAEIFEVGTVGHAVRNLISRLFPGEPVKGIRNAMHEQPDYFDCLLQAKLRLFGE